MVNKNSNQTSWVLDIISIIIILFGFIVLLSYYFQIYTRQVDVLIIIITFILGVDCLIYIKHSKIKKYYLILGLSFFLVSIAHTYRFFWGPAHCILSRAISIYFYDGFAIIIGLLLLSLSIELIKRKSGKRYHHIAGILVGVVMIINHIIKIILGKCI